MNNKIKVGKVLIPHVAMHLDIEQVNILCTVLAAVDNDKLTESLVIYKNSLHDELVIAAKCLNN